MCGTIIRTKVDEVYEEGLEKGIEKGEMQGDMNARRIIMNMHNKGFGLTDIADMVQVSLETVQVSLETVKQCLAGVAIPPAK